MAMKFCVHCDEKVAENAIVCKYCGTATFRVVEETDEAAGGKKTLKIISSIVVLLLFILGVIYFLL